MPHHRQVYLIFSRPCYDRPCLRYPSCCLQHHQRLPYPPPASPTLLSAFCASRIRAARRSVLSFSSSTCHLATTHSSAASRMPGATCPPPLAGHEPTLYGFNFRLPRRILNLPWSLRRIEKRRGNLAQGSEPVDRCPARSRVVPTATICANLIRQGNRPLLFCRTLTSAKNSRRFRVVVSMLSHFVLLGFVAYERLAWSALRWKPRTRRRT